MNPEIHINHTRFEKKWRKDLNSCIENLSKNETFQRSYSRLVTFQAWRSEILQDSLSPSALQFALEGQNDLLVSYLLARGGQWRSSLQSLRASLEGYLNCLYFMDHPVEAQLWEFGRVRNQFSELVEYFSKHPINDGLERKKYGLDLIKSEYATLSKAVHASAVSFRMSKGDEPSFFSDDTASVGKWESRQTAVCRGLNLLLLSLFRDQLTASRKRNMRKAIALSLTPSDRAWVKETFSVTLHF